MTIGAARSATALATAATTTLERPTATVVIGSREYTARAPKIDVWREVTRMLSGLDLSKSLAAKGNDRTEDEQALLDDLLVELSDLDTLEAAVVTGREIRDETGAVIAIEGGFVRRCLTKEDWQSVWREWKDDDSDLDLDSLFILANTLQEHFEPWFRSREEAIGLPPTAPAKRAPRRKPTPAKGATKRR